jgi:hypothetical protein
MPNVTEMQMDLAGKITFELDNGTTKIVDLANLGSGGGGGSVTANDITDAGASGKDVLRASTVTAIKTVLALVKADVGLANADNTSDVNKPVSTAQQTALNLKADKTTVTAGTALTTRNTTDADDAGVFTTASAITVTIHSGAKAGFGFYVSGAGVVTVAGAGGVTVTEKRTTGATNPVAAVVQVGANAYEVIGSKA